MCIDALDQRHESTPLYSFSFDLQHVISRWKSFYDDWLNWDLKVPMFILFLKSSSSSLMNCSRMSFKNLYESSLDKIRKYSATIVLSHVAHLCFARGLDIFQRRILHHLDQSRTTRFSHGTRVYHDPFCLLERLHETRSTSDTQRWCDSRHDNISVI